MTTSEFAKAKHHFSLALLALKNADPLKAEIELRKALQFAPSRPSILANLSAALIQQQKWDEAKKICSELLVIEPNSVEGLINLGICEQRIDNLDIALHYFNLALDTNPASVSAMVNKGNLFLDRGLFSDARDCFESALKLEPRSEEGHIGLGNLHTELKDYELGLNYFSLTLFINPSNFQAQWNKSLSLLRLGHYEEGWGLYESRWQIPGMAEYRKYQNFPLWLGKHSLTNKTVLIHSEQGFGDTIQMSRYLSILANQMGAQVIFEVNPTLLELMRTLDPKIMVISSDQPLIQQTGVEPDFQCPIMSLPLAFQTTIESIPNQSPYLYACEKKRRLWRNKLNSRQSSNTAFRVGITWSGSGHYAGKKNTKRDIPLDAIQSLIYDPEFQFVEFHAVQKELGNPHPLYLLNNVFLYPEQLDTFEDTAALIAELDLIVSIDTSTGHLSGALGKKTLLLIPDPPDFMAMTGITQSPWYPNTQFIRQTERGLWQIEKIRGAILNEINSKV